MISDFVTAFALVFVAELGDKSMLLALAFGTRYRVRPVLAGIFTAAVVATGLAVVVGTALGAALPERGLVVGSGVLFVAFGAWMMITRDGDDEVAELRGVRSDQRTLSVYLGVTGAFLLAELGDKTTLATAVLASTQAALPTWIGATLGMTLTSSIAILVGAALGARLPRRVMPVVAAAVFALFGLLLLYEGLTM